MFWNQNTIASGDVAEGGDHFGYALAPCARAKAQHAYLPLIERCRIPAPSGR